ncbi:MAG: ABC transporter substrate-binding protein, partial [Chloroflexota bacterium]
MVAVPTPTPGTQSQRGGILTIANPDSPAHFDLQQGVRIDTSIPFRNVYSALLRRDPQETEKIIPELAESWSASPDGLKYTFVLRKGVKWHDGQPLTTQDVAFSLMRMAHPPKGITSPRGQSLLEGVVTAKALDDARVEVTLVGTSSSFLSRVATDWVAIMPRHTIEKYGDMKQVVNGSGPFKFVRYTPSVSVEMTTNEEYFAQGRPFV